MNTLNSLLDSPWTLGVWAAAMLVSLAMVVRDLRVNNSQLGGTMKLVWGLTVVYSGPRHHG